MWNGKKKKKKSRLLFLRGVFQPTFPKTQIKPTRAGKSDVINLKSQETGHEVFHMVFFF